MIYVNKQDVDLVIYKTTMFEKYFSILKCYMGLCQICIYLIFKQHITNPRTHMRNSISFQLHSDLHTQRMARQLAKCRLCHNRNKPLNIYPLCRHLIHVSCQATENQYQETSIAIVRGNGQDGDGSSKQQRSLIADCIKAREMTRVFQE